MQDDRKRISRELEAIEHEMKTLEIAYEQYFSGIEKREPMKDRAELTKRIRQFANRRIMQTDLRFRYQNLATRFHSYNGYWERILKLMDEGKYHRNAAQTMKPVGTKNQAAGAAAAASGGSSEVDSIYNDLMTARKSCNIGGSAPDKAQIASMLDKQREKIREKFGDKPVAFKVETRDGKPRIVVKAKK